MGKEKNLPVGLRRGLHTKISKLQHEIITKTEGHFISKPATIRFLYRMWLEYSATLTPEQIKEKMEDY